MARLESGYRSAEELRQLQTLFRPVRGSALCRPSTPTACAVGYVLTPLRGCYLSARKLLAVFAV